MTKSEPKLLLGHARVDITPSLGIPMGGYAARDRGCDEIIDRLLADAIYFEYGPVTSLWITLDLVGVNEEWGNPVRQGIANRTGLNPDHILLLPSHTHFGPATGTYVKIDDPNHQTYLDRLTSKLIDVAEKAIRSPVNVALRIGQSDIGKMMYNRRLRRPDGSCCTVFSLPLPDNEKGLTFGPVDPTLTLLDFVKEDGSSALIFYTVPIHPVIGGDNYYGISADYPGVVRRILEEQLHAPVTFALGTAANLVPIKRGGGQRERIGRFLAGAAWKARSTAKPLRSKLAITHQMIDLPTEKRLDIDQMKALLEEAQHRAKVQESGETNRRRMSEYVRRMENLVRFTERFGPGETIPFEVTAMGLDDLGIVSLPGEIFVETGLYIQSRSPFDKTLILSLANQSTGYLPTRSAFWEGGYEATVSMMQPRSESIAADRAVQLLLDVWDQSREAPGRRDSIHI